MPNALKRLTLTALLALGSAAVSPARAVDPGLEWFTLTTPHFRVHYHAGEEALARRTAQTAERLQPRLSRDLAWRPGGRTDLVLDDESDLANGFATAFPYDRMQIYAVPPDAVDGLEDYGDWLNLLVTHEYTHVLHLDKAHGAPGVMRYIFGRNPLLFPNLFQPTWMTEGLATWEETDRKAGVGRGQSALYEMYMRMEVVSGVKPFDQVSMSGMTDWPAGIIPYLYGVHFYQFLEQRFGPKAYLGLIAEYSDNIVPFRLQSNFRGVLGWDTDTLWPAFKRYLWSRYDPQIAAIRHGGITAGERLTRYGYRTGAPRLAADGRLYYIRSDDLHRPAIMVREAGGDSRVLAHVHPDARLDLDDRTGLLVAQPELCESRYLYYDLYRVDPDSGAMRRLTRCGRYHFGAWSPGGGRIAAARIAQERSALVLLDADGTRLRTLWTGERGVVLSALDWTPDGKAVIAAMFRPGSGWNLERFDLDNRRWRKLTDDPVIETTPRVGDEGRYLYYSSAHGGVYNLRRMDLRTGESTTLTNVLGGAFAPVPAANGVLYYRGYTADGYDIFRLDAPSRAPMPASHAPPLPKPATAASAGGTRYPVDDYSPWRSLLPRWWMPTLYATEDLLQVGAYTTGNDALDIHEYLLSLNYESQYDLVGGGLSYAYDQRYRFSYQRWHSFDFVNGNTDKLESIRRHDQAEAVVSFPRVRVDYLLAAHLGVGWQWDRDVERPAGGPEDPEKRDALVGAAVTWNNTVEPPRAISPGGGRDIRVTAETSDVLNSDFSGEVYSLDWHEYLDLWGKHVLALRVAGGWGTDRPRPFELGGANPVSEGPLTDTFLFNRRDYPLRGYPTGLDRLTGRRMQLNSAEWHFPIATVQRAFTVPFVGLHRLHGDMFVDNGTAWSAGRDPAGYATGAGTELFADLNAFYIINLRLGLGFARGFDEGGENQVYLTLSGLL